MSRRRIIAFVLSSWGLAVASPVRGFVSPADQPARMSARAALSPLFAISRAGQRIVAVGQRGHIVYSDDDGGTWRQAAVPASVDLCGVSFPNEKVGWAVGHGGVVLRTADGGVTWLKQLAGLQATEIAVRYYERDSASTPEEALALAQAKSQLSRGAAQSFLDVVFETDTSGFIVGAFNSIFRTDDGGLTWIPWMDRTSNPKELHFYSVRGAKARVFLTGEQGLVWRLDASSKRFVLVPAPYTGTFFGLVVGDRGDVLAFGMRGTVFRSADEGRSWQKTDTGTGAGITAGAILPDGRIALVDQGGNLHLSLDGGKTFLATRLDPPLPIYSIAAGPEGHLVLAGAAGVTRLPLR